jgi:hypothetical protein
MPLKKIAIGAGLVVAGVIMVPMVIAPLAFDVLFPEDANVAQLSEWQVLRDVEAAHHDAQHEAPVLIVRGVLESGYTAIGFPARKRERGYVWVLANPTTAPHVKQMPSDHDFAVSHETIAWVKTQTALDPRVAAYLKSPVHTTSRGIATAGQGSLP